MGIALKTPDSAGSLRKFTIVAYLLSIGATAPFMSFNITFSIAFGGALALSGLIYLEYFLKMILSNGFSSDTAKSLSMISYYLRFAIVGFVTVMAMKAGFINVPALLIGLSLNTFAIFIWYIFTSGLLRLKSEEYERTN